MQYVYFWSGVLTGSFLFLPFALTAILSLVLMAVFPRYYFALFIFFLLDVTGETAHSFSLTLLPPFDHVYFPLTILGVGVYSILVLIKKFLWVERV